MDDSAKMYFAILIPLGGRDPAGVGFIVHAAHASATALTAGTRWASPLRIGVSAVHALSERQCELFVDPTPEEPRADWSRKPIEVRLAPVTTDAAPDNRLRVPANLTLLSTYKGDLSIAFESLITTKKEMLALTRSWGPGAPAPLWPDMTFADFVGLKDLDVTELPLDRWTRQMFAAKISSTMGDFSGQPEARIPRQPLTVLAVPAKTEDAVNTPKWNGSWIECTVTSGGMAELVSKTFPRSWSAPHILDADHDEADPASDTGRRLKQHEAESEALDFRDGSARFLCDLLSASVWAVATLERSRSQLRRAFGFLLAAQEIVAGTQGLPDSDDAAWDNAQAAAFNLRIEINSFRINASAPDAELIDEEFADKREGPKLPDNLAPVLEGWLPQDRSGLTVAADANVVLSDWSQAVSLRMARNAATRAAQADRNAQHTRSLVGIGSTVIGLGALTGLALTLAAVPDEDRLITSLPVVGALSILGGVGLLLVAALASLASRMKPPSTTSTKNTLRVMMAVFVVAGAALAVWSLSSSPALTVIFSSQSLTVIIAASSLVVALLFLLWLANPPDDGIALLNPFRRKGKR